MVKAKSRGSISEQMDDLLGKPPVPKSMLSKGEFNAQEDELLNLRLKLDKKEKTLNEREKDIKQELKEVEKQLKVLKKTRADVWSDIDKLRNEREKLTKTNESLYTEISDHRRQIKDAKEVHKLLARKQAIFDKKENKIKEREIFISKKEKNVSSLDRNIRIKERELNRLSHLSVTEKEAFDKRKKHLLVDNDRLEKEQILLKAQVGELTSEFNIEGKRLKQAMHDVKELYGAAEKKNKALDRRSLDVDAEIEQKRFAFIKNIEKKLNHLEGREEKINKISINLDKQELDLRASQDEIDKEHKKMKDERKEEEIVRKKIIELTTEERIIEQRLSEKQNKLNAFATEYQTEKTELERDHRLLDDKETEIVNRIRQLEEDEELLADKEDEIIDKIHELEKDKKAFDDKVEEFSSDIDRIEDFDRESKDKEADFRKNELEIAKLRNDLELKEHKVMQAAEYKLNINTLKQEKGKLQKEVKKLESRAKKASEINEKLDIREKKLSEREIMLGDKDKHIKDLLSDMTSEREKLTTQEFSTYFEKELQEEVTIQRDEEVEAAVELVKEENPANYQLLSLISDARDALGSEKLSNARAIYSKLNTLYMKLPKNMEKKKLYYEILELKTDIELKAV